MAYMRQMMRRADAKREAEQEGGTFKFTISPLARFRRFLVLGSENPLYCATDCKPGLESALALRELLEAGHGPACVALIAEYASEGRVAKQDNLTFALAFCAKFGDAATRALAYESLSKVCGIPTTLFSFLEFFKLLCGAGTKQWGRMHRRGVARWYTSQPAIRLALQMTKYANRNGWTHRDVLRLCHATPGTAAQNACFAFVCVAAAPKKRALAEASAEGSKAKNEQKSKKEKKATETDKAPAPEAAAAAAAAAAVAAAAGKKKRARKEPMSPAEAAAAAAAASASASAAASAAITRTASAVASSTATGDASSAKAGGAVAAAAVEGPSDPAAVVVAPMVAAATAAAAAVALDEETGKVLAFLTAVERAKACTEAGMLAALISEFHLVREHCPTTLLDEPAVWQALLAQMPLMALLRNLNKLSAVGLLAAGSENEQAVVARLLDEKQLQRARIHPFNALLTMHTYSRGQGELGKMTWAPNAAVCAALQETFYKCFKNLAPIGKRVVFALDVSGSMDSPILNSPLSSREAASALLMTCLRQCPGSTVMAFSRTFVELPITSESSLQDVLDITRGLPFESTNCALPMLWAQDQRIEADAFVVFTDNETNCGDISPAQALREYRRAMNMPDAKLVVFATANTPFSIADPNDENMLDMAGLDSSAPAVMSDFLAGKLLA